MSASAEVRPAMSRFATELHVDLTRVIRDTLDVAKGTNRPMLFCSPDFTLPAELLKDVTVLAYDLPTVEQLRTVFAELQRASTARRRKARARGVVLPEPAPIS